VLIAAVRTFAVEQSPPFALSTPKQLRTVELIASCPIEPVHEQRLADARL
jgi:hypothetical protein